MSPLPLPKNYKRLGSIFKNLKRQYQTKVRITWAVWDGDYRSCTDIAHLDAMTISSRALSFCQFKYVIESSTADKAENIFWDRSDGVDGHPLVPGEPLFCNIAFLFLKSKAQKSRLRGAVFKEWRLITSALGWKKLCLIKQTLIGHNEARVTRQNITYQAIYLVELRSGLDTASTCQKARAHPHYW